MSHVPFSIDITRLGAFCRGGGRELIIVFCLEGVHAQERDN